MLLLVALLLSQTPAASAQSADALQTAQLPQLKQLSLEELLEVDVTLPLRRPERAVETAAAVTVLTSEDVWRSGAVSLAEVLRAAPGIFVGRFSASSWVITARGFGSTAANKLLVMMDGRSLYSPLFSGVFWEQQDYPLADIDRIEVVRGPGASLWGSNAVNGVINVITKNARDTQGTIISGGTGAEERGYLSMRHGGRAGPGYYRLFGKVADRDDAHLIDGTAADDWQRLGQFGGRFDSGDTANNFTLQGDAFISRVGVAGRDNLEAGGANVMARWAKQLAPASQLQVQFYFDRTSRFVPQQFQETRNTADAELQHRFPIGSRQTFSWGAGYRISRDNTTPTALLFFDPEDRQSNLASAFLQDEVSVGSHVGVTAGARFEHNDYTGVEVQPTARVRWSDAKQTIWTGLSRAVRLPTRLDADVRITVGGRVVIAGNPEFESENVVAVEGGYRVMPSSLFNADITVFRNRYTDLRTQELPSAAGLPITVGNGLDATASGLEITARLQPRGWMRLTTAYAYLTTDLALDPASKDPTRGLNEAVDPHHQFLAQGRLDLPRQMEFDVAVRHISSIPNPGTPAYTEANLRLAWRPVTKLEIALIGRDLLHAQHLEFVSPTSTRRTALERAVFTRVTVAF